MHQRTETRVCKCHFLVSVTLSLTLKLLCKAYCHSILTVIYCAASLERKKINIVEIKKLVKNNSMFPIYNQKKKNFSDLDLQGILMIK